jgi:hypothetical protein
MEPCTMSKNRSHIDAAYAAMKADAQRYEDEKAMVVRVCHELSGVCVMALKSPHEDCNTENCSAFRAGFKEVTG